MRTVPLLCRLTLVLLLVAGLVPAAAGAAVAAPAPEPPGELAPTMVVLDGSGSMTGPDPSGGTKIDAARQAVHALVDGTADGAPLGLAVYGTGTGNAPEERDRGCQDVSVVRGPLALDRGELLGAVDRVTPRGYTPIGRSLQVAAEQLPSEGPRSVVLVSDGEDTCAPPEPCEVARTLAESGVDLVVHTVGFGVDDPAREQLGCIARTTGGTYTDAPEGSDLQRVLPRVAATALRNYEPTGAPITGGPDAVAAPTAGPGDYLDTIGQRETRFYALDVPAGATARFSATVAYPRVPDVDTIDDFNSLILRTLGATGRDCLRSSTEQQNRSSDGAPLTVATVWDGAEPTATGPDGCTGPGRYVFSLEWGRVSAGVPARLPVELSLAVEPGVTDPGPPGVLPAAELTPGGTEPVPVPAGATFGSAAELAGPGAYTDVVRRGEFVFYRVRLEWGQSLAYRVTLAETPGRGPANVSFARTVLYAPSREEIGQVFTSYNGAASVLPHDRPALSTHPVRYLNRESTDVAVRPQSVPGWFYIGVQVSPPRDERSASAAPVPVRLDLSVGGAVEPGPAYAVATPGPAAGQADADGRADDGGDTRDGAWFLPFAVAAGAIPVIGVFAWLRWRRRR
ncbi:Ca-activated chloride channel family protein [Pseudonocardia autotrophica]|uniref:von Willebrand factor type A domain protein n=2 Tax=Pseudonocardia TaxID=1847 RepID=A0A1Y2MHA4_PSEAH|nr:von Willebrand factor type A domain protein [Pseudonocardia autotrophica]TDN75427.1 Ca-activated chloride channel family protein [Pseudonocardia autotrophica]BBF99387.1 hypothetical protein Pdca_05970 [Pseudonocardia autotrophica]